jgi:DNA repair exonuclease SbcCD nuclease subunit
MNLKTQGEEAEEVALKLLHTADWHLGRRFPAFDETDQRKLTRARLDVVGRLLMQAEQYAVDAVLCAGDLFDDPDPDRIWWEGLLTSLGEHDWSQRPVFLLPGNHDPLTPRSLYSAAHPFRRALPAGVHVVDRDDFEFELSEEAVLYAAPCRSRAGEKDLALSLPKRQAGDERIRVGLVHGQTFDVEGCQMNFPIDKHAARRRGLDYLAVGDTHGFRLVPTATQAPTVYPGAPEATNFGERDAGHVSLVFFRRRGRRALVQKVAVGHWTWREERIEEVAALRQLCRGEDQRRTVLRLILDLKVSLEEQAEVESLLAELKGTEASQGSAGILVVQREGLELDTTDVGELLSGLPPVLRAAVDQLREEESSGDRRKAQRALYHLYQLVRSAEAGP